MSPAGIVRRVPLQDKAVLPLRAVVDTTVGRARVSTSLTRLRTQNILLYAGAFNIAQSAAKLAVTRSRCRAVMSVWRGSSAQRDATPPPIRGTKWMTEDRCDGTLTGSWLAR